MTTDKIAEKIRKLLRLARGTPNPGEAQSAMDMAQRLLLENGLSMTADDDSDTDRGFQQETVFEGKRFPAESRHVWSLVEEFFFCRVLSVPVDVARRRGIILIGRPEHVAVSKYVGVYLSRTYRALWSVYKRQHFLQGDGERRGYYLGLTIGISGRLNKSRSELARIRPELATAALICTNQAELTAEIARRFGTPRKYRGAPVRSHRNTILDGIERGCKIDIRPGIAAPASQLRLG